MASRRKHKKKRLKEDQLVTYAVKASRFTREHFTMVVGGLAVLIVASAIILFTAQAREKAAKEAEQTLALAMNYHMLGSQDLAARTFQDIIAQHSGRRAGVIARYFLGECLLGQAQYAEAASAYDDYIAKSGKHPEFKAAAMIGKAYALEGLGSYKQAAEILDELAPTLESDDPRYFDILLRAAHLYQRAGDRDRALEHFQDVADRATGRAQQEAEVAVVLLEQK